MVGENRFFLSFLLLIGETQRGNEASKWGRSENQIHAIENSFHLISHTQKDVALLLVMCHFSRVAFMFCVLVAFHPVLGRAGDVYA